jgi:hypothetical protein
MLNADAGSAESVGWEVLYREARDGRLWEPTYPWSGMHGGGPPRLHLPSPEEAHTEYHLGAA